MEAAAAVGEAPRLPEELLATIISLTSPQDACRAAAVSRAFLAAADSDTVWSGFLPRDLPRLIAEDELPRAPPSKKALFRRLSVTPALLPCKLVSMRLDRATGAKCFLLSARALHIARGETPASWQWIHLRSDEIQGNERFSEAARLRKVSWLEIRAKMQCRMLSQNSAYAAYMVFKLADSGFNKLDYPFQVASVGIGWDRSTRKVCLQGYMEVGGDGVTRKHIWRSSWEENWRPCKRSRVTGAIHLKDKIVLPRRRADGWMEVELGEFYNKEGDDGEVSVGLMQTTGGYKSGLVVLGVEIRSKQ